MKSQNLCLTVFVALAAGAFVACAPPPTASTAITAAEVSRPSPAEAPPVAEAVEASEVPAGQLACRTKSRVDGTSELYLEWNGGVAKGVLRRAAPSGMVYVQRVQAERSNGMIVADDAGETDLVVHAAVVRQENGKQLMRLGDGTQSWSICE